MSVEVIDLQDLEILEEAVAPCGSIGCGGGAWC
jgi:hypothetical protein